MRMSEFSFFFFFSCICLPDFNELDMIGNENYRLFKICTFFFCFFFFHSSFFFFCVSI